MTVALDDLSCLLYLIIDGLLLNHNDHVSSLELVELMVELLGDEPDDVGL
jgi:hypothetical protein